MPWCPQCGTEYREGYAQCPECGVALQAEVPNLPRLKRKVLPRFLERPWGDALRAWGYGVAAARVLRRYPALLLIPLAVSLLDVSERKVGNSFALRVMPTKERAFIERMNSEEERRGFHERLVATARHAFNVRRTIVAMASPLPELPLSGTTYVLTELVVRQTPTEPTGRINGIGERAVFWVAFLLPQLLISIPVMSATTGGIYALARTASRKEPLSSALFWTGIRAYFCRFYAFNTVLLGAMVASPIVIFAQGFTLTSTMYRVWAWVVDSAILLIALIPVAIVVDNHRIWPALRISVKYVIRTIGIAAVLFFMLTIIRGVPILVVGLFPLWRTVGLSALALPRELALGVFGVLVGTWFLLVTFLWYRDVAALFYQTSTEAAFDTSPILPLESA